MNDLIFTGDQYRRNEVKIRRFGNYL